MCECGGEEGGVDGRKSSSLISVVTRERKRTKVLVLRSTPENDGKTAFPPSRTSSAYVHTRTSGHCGKATLYSSGVYCRYLFPSFVLHANDRRNVYTDDWLLRKQFLMPVPIPATTRACHGI